MFGDKFHTVFSLNTDRTDGMYDLALTAVVTVFAAVVLLVPVNEPTLLRLLAGLPLLLFLPGYALSSALFPARAETTPRRTMAIRNADVRGLSFVERVVVSVVASVALVGAAGIIANAVVGVSLVPILTLVVTFTLFATVTAYTRRLRLPESRRYSPLSALAGPTGLSFPASATGWFLLVAAVLSLVVVGAVGVVALGPDGEGVTEFYVGGETANGTIAMGAQPTDFTAGVAETHFLVLEQRQPTASNYTIVAQVDDGANGTGPSTEIGRYQVTLNDTGTAVQPVRFSIGTDRTDPRVVYYLYEGTAPNAPSKESALRYLGVDLNVDATS